MLPLALVVLSFAAPGDRNVIAQLTIAGKEGAVALLSMDGGPDHHLHVLDAPVRYDVLLGKLPKGDWKLRINGAEVVKSEFATSADPIYDHAPVLYARHNTIGKFSDIPLLVYAERLPDKSFQYTVVFSNEDGGTSTRALMARWGRTTDIEYVYRVWPDQGRAIIQSRDHKDIEFTGPYEDKHPVLIPVTDNNMVAGEGKSEVRTQLAPVVVDLTTRSREAVMDENPALYRAMARELEREGKLRPFGTVDGQTISDPRNYLYIEANVTNEGSRVYPMVRAGGVWRRGNLGRIEYGIERSGWVRTAIELPPGVLPDEIGFGCDVVDRNAIAGKCTIESVSKAFLLDKDYVPQRSIFRLDYRVEIPTGELWVRPLR